jgi:hypothetical protein
MNVDGTDRLEFLGTHDGDDEVGEAGDGEQADEEVFHGGSP